MITENPVPLMSRETSSTDLPEASPARIYSLRKFDYDLDNNVFRKDGVEIPLIAGEQEILQPLVQNPRVIFPVPYLQRTGDKSQPKPKFRVESLILSLRSKMPVTAKESKEILKNVIGKGYVFVDESPPEDSRGFTLLGAGVAAGIKEDIVVVVERAIPENDDPILTTGEHPHHWLLNEPSGETSKGRCKKCGTEKEFKNFNPDVMDF